MVIEDVVECKVLYELFDLIIFIIKFWLLEFGFKVNLLVIQILGGVGYICEYFVE